MTKMVALIGVAAAITFSRGCHHVESPEPTTEPTTHPAATGLTAVETDVSEGAYRELLKNVPHGVTAYLSLGKTNAGWVDPPDEFIARFADLKIKIAKPSGIQTADKNDLLRRHIVDEKGVAAYVYWVKFRRWIDKDHVIVEIGRYGGSLDAYGEGGVMYKEDGEWLFQSNGSGWRS